MRRFGLALLVLLVAGQAYAQVGRPLGRHTNKLPALLDILAQGADANGVAITNIGGLTLADGAQLSHTSTQAAETEWALTVTPSASRNAIPGLLISAPTTTNWAGGSLVEIDASGDAHLDLYKLSGHTGGTSIYELFSGANNIWGHAYNGSNGLSWTLRRDVDAGDAITFNASGGRELVDSDAHQAWLNMAPVINQPDSGSDPSWSAIDISATVTAEDTSVTNYIITYDEGGSDLFAVATDGTIRSAADENGNTVANTANQICTTTCGSATCWAGIDTATGNFVTCSDGTADSCLCLPAP